MTTKKERREALGRMTKAELVKTVVALDARQTKLLNEVTHAKEVAEAHSAVAVALQRAVTELEHNLALARSVAKNMAERHACWVGSFADPAPEACGLCDVTTKPPHCEVPDCPRERAGPGPDPYDETRVLPQAPSRSASKLAGVHNALRDGKPFPWEQE